MSFEPTKTEGLKMELVSGGDSAGHQRRLNEWLAEHPESEIVDIQFRAFSDGNSRTGMGFSTLIIYR